MIYRSKINPTDYSALKDLQIAFGWSNDQLDYLVACMMFESGLNPQAVNKISGAVGLIQFIKPTYTALGYTKEQVLNMTFAEQVRKLVQPYFKPYYKRTKTLNDMYMAILMPKYIGTPDNTVIFSEGKPYNQNKALDKNKDGHITKAEACQYVNHLYLKGQRDI